MTLFRVHFAREKEDGTAEGHTYIRDESPDDARQQFFDRIEDAEIASPADFQVGKAEEVLVDDKDLQKY